MSDKYVTEKMLEKALERNNEKLVQMINAGFQSVQDQFKLVHERFEGVEKRIDSMEKRIESIEKRIDSIEKRLDSMEKRLDLIDDELASIKADLMQKENALSEVRYEEMEDLSRRVGVIEKHLGIKAPSVQRA